jgi:hypothetical protein
LAGSDNSGYIHPEIPQGTHAGIGDSVGRQGGNKGGATPQETDRSRHIGLGPCKGNIQFTGKALPETEVIPHVHPDHNFAEANQFIH